jgi:hypothetical protein
MNDSFELVRSQFLLEEKQVAGPLLNPILPKKKINLDKAIDSPLAPNPNFLNKVAMSQSCKKVIKDKEGGGNLAWGLRGKKEENFDNVVKILDFEYKGKAKAGFGVVEIVENLEEARKTPTFTRNKSEEIQELKEMCDRLKSEQEQLKNQLSFQRNLIKVIGNGFKTSRAQGNMVAGPGQRWKGPANGLVLCKMRKCETPNKARNFKLPVENLNFSQIANRMDDSFMLPALTSINSDRKFNAGKLARIKYSRDLPMISKNIKFPKDIFVVKK